MRRTTITDKDGDQITVCQSSLGVGFVAVRLDSTIDKEPLAVYLTKAQSKKLRKTLKAAEKTL